MCRRLCARTAVTSVSKSVSKRRISVPWKSANATTRHVRVHYPSIMDAPRPHGRISMLLCLQHLSGKYSAFPVFCASDADNSCREAPTSDRQLLPGGGDVSITVPPRPTSRRTTGWPQERKPRGCSDKEIGTVSRTFLIFELWCHYSHAVV